jgi:hypothetical protein
VGLGDYWSAIIRFVASCHKPALYEVIK